MSRPRRSSRSKPATIVDAILVLVVIIVVLQLWLLTATVNAYQGGDASIAVPAAIASIACLGLNAGLLWYLYRLE
jgi:hypothetical protein